MGFRENLLKKMQIDRSADAVLGSLSHGRTEKRIDKESMRRLLEMGPYRMGKKRDLELYFPDENNPSQDILVLDNALAFYNTDQNDIALRKSPTIKEMISIKNAVKILNDASVITDKKADSVIRVKKQCIALLDLSFNKEDIRAIEQDGVISLEGQEADRVLTCLKLFVEILGWRRAPAFLLEKRPGVHGFCRVKKAEKIFYGPLTVFDEVENRLIWIEIRTARGDTEVLSHIQKVIAGADKADAWGAAVFELLGKTVMDQFLSDRPQGVLPVASDAGPLIDKKKNP